MRGPNFQGDIFHYDQPIVIASRRGSACMEGVQLRYNADGYLAGQVLARNTVDGLYDKYVDGTASGVGTAACILFQPVKVEDFPGTTGTVLAAGIVAGCDLFKSKLTGYDAAALVDLKGREFTGFDGVTLVVI